MPSDRVAHLLESLRNLCEESEGFIPPQAVREAAAKGLKYRKMAGGKGGLSTKQASKEGIGSGVQRAVNLKNGDRISLKVIKQMKAFFDRHQKNRDIAPGKEPWEDRGWTSWLLWGGDPGYAWAKKILRKHDLQESSLGEASAKRFVVQKHDATNTHYDFRLEMDGKLKSWAVPKQPPKRVGLKRLAIKMPDHELDYIDFEGDIPEDEYGAGHVSIWDSGTYDLVSEDSDHIKVEIHGKRMNGLYVLVLTQRNFKDKDRAHPSEARKGVKTKKAGGEKWLFYRLSDNQE